MLHMAVVAEADWLIYLLTFSERCVRKSLQGGSLSTKMSESSTAVSIQVYLPLMIRIYICTLYLISVFSKRSCVGMCCSFVCRNLRWRHIKGRERTSSESQERWLQQTFEGECESYRPSKAMHDSAPRRPSSGARLFLCGIDNWDTRQKMCN